MIEPHPPAEPADGPPAPGLARRLLIGAGLCALVALACWLLLPRAGLYVPWYVPVLAFGVILIAAIAGGGAGAGGADGDSAVAGRIGPGDNEIIS